jgi:hypothetical protein
MERRDAYPEVSSGEAINNPALRNGVSRYIITGLSATTRTSSSSTATPITRWKERHVCMSSDGGSVGWIGFDMAIVSESCTRSNIIWNAACAEDDSSTEARGAEGTISLTMNVCNVSVASTEFRGAKGTISPTLYVSICVL